MSVAKVEQSIGDSCKVIFEHLKQYYAAVEDGLSHVTLLVAHKTTLESIKNSDIEETELYFTDPSIKLKLIHILRMEIDTEEQAISSILIHLEDLYLTIIKQCDKVFNTYRSCVTLKLTLDEITKGSETSYCIATKIEALDLFKRQFSNSHLVRKYSTEYSSDINKLGEIWKTTDLKTAERELSLAVAG